MVRVPPRRTIERRLHATRPEAEVQVQALGPQILAEGAPDPDQPPAPAIDGRRDQAQGPLGQARDRAQGRVPPTLGNGDTEAAWSKRGERGWGQGERLGRHGSVFPAPVPLFARWWPNAGGESTVLAHAPETKALPVTDLLLGEAPFGSPDLGAASGQQGGGLLTPQQLPANPASWEQDLYA